MAKPDQPRAQRDGPPRPAHPPGLPAFSAAVDRRGAALAAGAVVFVVSLLAYAGPSTPIVLFELAFDSVFLSAWLLAAVGFGATLLRVFRLREGDEAPALLPVVTSAALGLGVMSLAVLGTGLAGLLNRASAFGLVGAGIALAAVQAARYAARHRPGQTDAAFRAWLGAPAGWQWLWLLLMPVLAMAVVGALVPPGMLWTPDEPHGYDVVEYHLQVAREWHEAGRIVPLRHNVFSFFPFNIEMQYLLAMHLVGGPWKGMYLAQLMHAVYVALSVLAVYGFARSIAPSPAGAVIATVAGASVPWLALLAPVAYNEGGLLLYGVLAIGWAIRATAAGLEGGSSVRRLALAGAMAGFACGVKLTAVPTVLLAVPAALAVEWVVERRSHVVTFGAGVLAYVVVGVVAFAPWLGRNVAWAGNPVFPEAMPLLGRAHFAPTQVERWERAHAPPQAQRSAPARLKAFGREVLADWRFGFISLPLALMSLVAVRRRGAGPWFLLTVLAVLAVFWLGFTHFQGRFFVLAVPVGALLIARIDWGRWAGAGLTVAMLALLIGGVSTHLQFVSRLYGERQWVRVIGAPGDVFDQLPVHPPELLAMPPDATLTLVGEARAFWFPREMKRLRYRTVFDVDVPTGGDVVEAWRGRPLPNEWLLIDPAELTRFSQTYAGIPAPPADVRAKERAYVAPPAATARTPPAPPPAGASPR